MKKRPYKLLSIVVISMGIHLLLIYVLMQNHTIKANQIDKSAPVQPLPIQAKLIFAPIKSPIKPVEVVEEINDVVEKQRDIPENNPIEEQPVNQDLPSISNTDEVDTARPEEVAPPPQKAQNKLPAIDYSSAPDTARQQLSGLNQSKLQSLAQQAAREYREQQNSPQLELKPANPFITEDEKLRESMEVKVNCDGYTNSAATVMSGLFGGNLKCTKTPEIDSFIQKRINKTDLLPHSKDPK